MKEISLHCSCGATVRLVDNAESYIDPKNGSPDKQGRRYQIELSADRWLELHKKCIDIKNQLLIKASERKPEPRVVQR